MKGLKFTPDFIDEIDRLLAQPEQEPDYYLWHDEVHEQHPTNEGDPDVYPLYTHPPKRDPLTGREISHGFRLNPDATHAESYWAGVEYAEKAHGIGGGDGIS